MSQSLLQRAIANRLSSPTLSQRVGSINFNIQSSFLRHHDHQHTVARALRCAISTSATRHAQHQQPQQQVSRAQHVVKRTMLSRGLATESTTKSSIETKVPEKIYRMLLDYLRLCCVVLCCVVLCCAALSVCLQPCSHGFGPHSKSHLLRNKFQRLSVSVAN